MVHYIRFLKAPKVQGINPRQSNVKCLITITTDLGDDFYQGDIMLYANLVWSGKEQVQKRSLRKRFKWRPGLRSLWILYESIPSEICRSAHLQVTSSETHTDGFDSEVYPDILSAWSEDFGIDHSTEASRRVERRLKLRPGNILSIFEDPGESIARHIWYVSCPSRMQLLTAAGMQVLHCLRTWVLSRESRYRNQLCYLNKCCILRGQGVLKCLSWEVDVESSALV